MSLMQNPNFGDYVRGHVLIDDGQGVRLARPARIVDGEVIGLYAQQSDVARVQVYDAQGVRTEETPLIRVEWTI